MIVYKIYLMIINLVVMTKIILTRIIQTKKVSKHKLLMKRWHFTIKILISNVENHLVQVGSLIDTVHIEEKKILNVTIVVKILENYINSEIISRIPIVQKMKT